MDSFYDADALKGIRYWIEYSVLVYHYGILQHKKYLRILSILLYFRIILKSRTFFSLKKRTVALKSLPAHKTPGVLLLNSMFSLKNPDCCT